MHDFFGTTRCGVTVPPGPEPGALFKVVPEETTDTFYWNLGSLIDDTGALIVTEDTLPPPHLRQLAGDWRLVCRIAQRLALEDGEDWG